MAATKFTPENRAVILSQLRTGGSLAGACRDIGVRLKTAEGWLTRGRRETEGPYAEFAAAVDGARAEHERAGLTPEEFEKYLAKAVRAGSVQAMKLWHEIHVKNAGGDGAEAPSQPNDPFDDLEGGDNVVPMRGAKRGG